MAPVSVGAALVVRVLRDSRCGGHRASKERESECTEVLVRGWEDHGASFMVLPHSWQNLAERITCEPQLHVACVICISIFWRM